MKMKEKGFRKRFAGLVLAGVMILSSAVPANAQVAVGEAAGQNAVARAAQYEQITSGSATDRSTQLPMSGDRAVITVEVISSDGSFRTSVVDGDKYITTTTDGQSWYSKADGSPISHENGTAGGNVIQGHIYEVRYTKNASNYTIEYYDVSTNASLHTYRANNTNINGATVSVYAKAVAGTYRVYNCSAEDAGFSVGDVSAAVQMYDHGRDRTRRVLAPDNTVPAGYDVNPATQGNAKDGAYDKYFLKDALQEVKITIDGDNLDYVLQNAASKESALAKSVTIGDATVQNVGLKTKGNFTMNRTMESTSDRFSFTINFGKYVKKKYEYSETQNFFGCRKISFNNFYFDKTMMKEYNAFRLLTEMGLPTPQYGLAKLYINNEFYGVYFMLEAMDPSILEQYYNTSSKNLSSYLTKPSYYSPRCYTWDFDGCISADGEITWDALVKNGYIIENKDGTYSYGSDTGIQYYTGLWENDMETFQDVVKDLPTVFTWLYRLTMLSNGKDFQDNDIDVNSAKYLELLGKVMDVDETVKYFATHSFLVQMDNLFTWRQNYGLYVNQGGQSVIVPWDYDLAWGYEIDPADGEAVANWNVDKLYNKVAQEVYYYTDDLSKYYAGSPENGYLDMWWENSGSGYPLFNVIYQNKSLMEKFHTYMKDCSKIADLGGTTSAGNYYEAGRFGATIDSLYDKVVAAASEPLADNVYYLQYDQPNDVKRGLKGLKQMIALRSVGVWLQINKINAKVTGYGYETGSLGNDATSAKYTTSGNNIAVVDDSTGIFTIANYAESEVGPKLSAKKLEASSEEYKAVETSLKGMAEAEYASKQLTVYALSDTKKATSDYKVYLPVSSKDAVIYSYSNDGTMKQLVATTYDNCTKMVTVSELSSFAVLEETYKADFNVDDEVESIDIYYTQNYDKASEKNVTSAIARNSDTGISDLSGEGQINFKVNLKDGYKISSVSVDKNYKDNYKNIKTPAETEGPGVYRITKITGDLAVTVKTVQATEFEAVFKTDDGVESIDVYHTSVYGEQPDDLNVQTTIVRNSKTGAADMTGDGQVNFKVNLKDGYMVKSITISGGYYKNVKLPAETDAENVYRVTKILGDVKIKVETQEYTDKYVASFVKDDGVASVDIYYKQDYSAASETNVTEAYARNSATGELDTSGAGQVNFKVNLKAGYKIKSVTADTNYNNLKGKEDTGVENIYRVTKITGNVKITIVTEKDNSTASVEISGCTVTLGQNSYVYDGSAKRPAVTVKNGSTVLKQGTDYSFSYSNNVNAGKAQVTITAKGSNYKGTKKVTFTITKAPNSITVPKTTIVLNASGTAQKVSLGASAKAGTLKYTSSNSKVTAKGQVTLPKNFSGSVKITIQTSDNSNYSSAKKEVTIKVPAAVSLKSVKNKAKGKALVKWKKVSGVTGYQIQYASKANFKNGKKVKVAGAAKDNNTLSKLGKKKTYYVRIRTYLTEGGKTYYGKWSGSKNVVIKK